MGDLLERIGKVRQVEETVPLDLGEFHESYRGAVFQVWVTPTQAHIEAFGDISAWLREEGERVQKMLAKLPADVRAGQDAAEAARMQAEWDERWLHWHANTWLNVSIDEARQIRDHLLEYNPRAWEWLTDRTQKTIGEYKRRVLGNSDGG